MKQEHEYRVCTAVIGLMERRKRETLTFVCAPDTEEHQNKAVELIYRGQSMEYVFEHTRIESFPQQIADADRFIKLLGPLEDRLTGTLFPPGDYELHVAVGATTVGKMAKCCGSH